VYIKRNADKFFTEKDKAVIFCEHLFDTVYKNIVYIGNDLKMRKDIADLIASKTNDNIRCLFSYSEQGERLFVETEDIYRDIADRLTICFNKQHVGSLFIMPIIKYIIANADYVVLPGRSPQMLGHVLRHLAKLSFLISIGYRHPFESIPGICEFYKKKILSFPFSGVPNFDKSIENAQMVHTYKPQNVYTSDGLENLKKEYIKIAKCENIEGRILFCDLIVIGRGLGGFIKIFKDIFSVSDESIKILSMGINISDRIKFYDSDDKYKVGLSYYDEKGTNVQLPLYECLNFKFPIPFDYDHHAENYCTIPKHPPVNWCNEIVYNKTVNTKKFKNTCIKYLNILVPPQANTFD